MALSFPQASFDLLVTICFPFLQTFLVWQLIFSAILLGRRYSSNEIAGCVTITAGVLVAVGRYHFFIYNIHVSILVISF